VKATRSTPIDTLRILGICAIVIGHTTPVARDALFIWHVPLFFFLTGWLWRDRPLRAELGTRFRTLLVPYVWWLAVVGAVFVAVYAIRERSLPLRAVVDAVYGGTVGRPFTTFWFFSALFVAAVVWRVTPARARLVVAAAGLAALTFAGPQLSAAPLAVAVGACCVFFVAAGQLARTVRLPWQVGAVLAVVGVTAAAVDVVAPLDLKYGDVGTPVASVAVSVLICWGALVTAEHWVPQAPWVSSLAAVGTPVILVHPLLLFVLGTGDGSLVEFVGVLVVSWLIGLGVARTSLRPRLVGASA